MLGKTPGAGFLVVFEEPGLNGFLSSGTRFDVIETLLERAEAASHALALDLRRSKNHDSIPLIVKVTLGEKWLKGGRRITPY